MWVEFSTHLSDPRDDVSVHRWARLKRPFIASPDRYDHDDYFSSPATNPAGASSSSLRGIRGGGWYGYGGGTRVAHRSYSGPGARNDYMGFRLLRMIPSLRLLRTIPQQVNPGSLDQS